MKILFRTFVAALALFFIFGFLYHLQSSPRIWFDEGIYLHIGKTLANSGEYNFQIAPGQYGKMLFISVGYPLIFPLAAVFKFFGASLLAGRLLMMVFAALLAFFSYVYVKNLSGSKWTALLSAALLVTFSSFYGNGKNVLGEIPGLLYLIFGSIFLLKTEKAQWKGGALVIAGLFFGLSAAAKPIFILIFGALCPLFLLLLAKRHISFKKCLIFFAACALPMLFWAYTQFGFYNWAKGARPASDVSNIFTDTLAHYFNPYNEQNPRSNAAANLKRFYTEITPLHFAIISAVVLFSVLLSALARKRDFALSQAALALFMVLVWISYLRTPGWYRYFFPAHIVALVLFSHSAKILFEKVFNFVGRAGTAGLGARLGHGQNFFLAAMLILISLQVARFWTQKDRHLLSDWAFLKNEIQSMPNKTILYYNAPEAAFFSQTDNFYQVLEIREGLEFGTEKWNNISDVDMIVAPEGYEEKIKATLGRKPDSQNVSDYVFYFLK